MTIIHLIDDVDRHIRGGALSQTAKLTREVQTNQWSRS
jgi:hypothetical protein